MGILTFEGVDREVILPEAFNAVWIDTVFTTGNFINDTSPLLLKAPHIMVDINYHMLRLMKKVY